MATLKEQVIEAMRHLPDNCTWDDVAYQVYVRRKVEAGLAAIDRRDVYSVEDAKRMWSNSAEEPMVSVKQAIVDLAGRLPNDCTWEDVDYRICVVKSVMEGIEDIEAGRVISLEEMKRKTGRWFRSDDSGNWPKG